jgi:hypothetical protein
VRRTGGPAAAANQLIRIRVGKVWKQTTPTNGSAASVTSTLGPKQSLDVDLAGTEMDDKNCKKLRKGVPYLLLLDDGQGQGQGLGQEAEGIWRAALPPVRLSQKLKKLIRPLFCEVIKPFLTLFNYTSPTLPLLLSANLTFHKISQTLYCR